MVWKTFQRLGRFVQQRHISIITASTTVVVGLVLYEKLKLKVETSARADFQPSHSDLSDSKEGSGDRSSYMLSGSKTGFKWDDNWDR